MIRHFEEWGLSLLHTGTSEHAQRYYAKIDSASPSKSLVTTLKAETLSQRFGVPTSDSNREALRKGEVILSGKDQDIGAPRGFFFDQLDSCGSAAGQQGQVCLVSARIEAREVVHGSN